MPDENAEKKSNNRKVEFVKMRRQGPLHKDFGRILCGPAVYNAMIDVYTRVCIVFRYPLSCNQSFHDSKEGAQPALVLCRPIAFRRLTKDRRAPEKGSSLCLSPASQGGPTCYGFFQPGRRSPA